MKLQKNTAARILKCGLSRIWIDPKRIADVKESITARDIRGLIKDDVIKALPKVGLSSLRKKKRALQKSRGRRKGPGSKKGIAKNKKRFWIKKIRSLRTALKEYRASGKLSPHDYRLLYKKSKSGFFRSKAHLSSYIDNMKKKQQ